MLFRVVLITVVLGRDAWRCSLAVAETLAAPARCCCSRCIGVTYVADARLRAASCRAWPSPLRFADVQIAGDLVITTVLVHVTGGAQSGYTFLYPLSIVGAATVRYRRGALAATAAALALFLRLVLVAGCVMPSRQRALGGHSTQLCASWSSTSAPASAIGRPGGEPGQQLAGAASAWPQQRAARRATWRRCTGDIDPLPVVGAGHRRPATGGDHRQRGGLRHPGLPARTRLGHGRRRR